MATDANTTATAAAPRIFISLRLDEAKAVGLELKRALETECGVPTALRGYQDDDDHVCQDDLASPSSQ
jgi:hypothetical protein